MSLRHRAGLSLMVVVIWIYALGLYAYLFEEHLLYLACSTPVFLIGLVLFVLNQRG